MNHNYLLRIAYDGTNFFGWQKTKMGSSIEEALQIPLEKIFQQPILLQAASRTDRGVHAEEQWVNFLCDRSHELPALQASLNALLPPTIRVLSLHLMPLDFHPTLNSQAKEYHYHISLGPFQMPHARHTAWHLPYPLDFDKMEEATHHFLGEQDFSSFCNTRKNLTYKDKIREITEIKLHPSPNHLLITITGNHFLYKMVRNIVGTLIFVGRGKIAPSSIPTILSASSRPAAGMTAPAHGLTLKKIYYPDFSEAITR